jgi:hypothetical protein|tara:strand:+ start:1491 stop:2567 length:1077 start_codon:yes stop_codon:yes gene_type:complete
MAYTTVNKSTDFFSPTIYTGNATARTITTGQQPDLIWIKQRNTTRPNVIYDSIQNSGFTGNSSYLQTDSAAQPSNSQSDQITGTVSTGFTMGTDTSSDQINHSGSTAVSWTWKAGTAVSGNTSGSGTAKAYSGTANATSKFSIIKWVGNGSSGQSIPHHLGSKPDMIWIKNLSRGTDWSCYQSAVGYSNSGDLSINTSSGQGAQAQFYTAEPTSTVFTVGNATGVNVNDENLIAYCWSNNDGYQKSGIYLGTGNVKGPFIYTGFKVQAVILKKYSGGANWGRLDSARDLFNVTEDLLLVDNSAAETTGGSANAFLDFHSNGFVIKNTDGNYNTDEQKYLYLALGQTIVGTNDIPANAY